MTISFNGIILIWCSVMSFICFMAMGMPDMIAIARKKLMADTKAEEATDTTQPVTKAEEVKDQQ